MEKAKTELAKEIVSGLKQLFADMPEFNATRLEIRDWVALKQRVATVWLDLGTHHKVMVQWEFPYEGKPE